MCTMYFPVESKGNETNGKNGRTWIKIIYYAYTVHLLFCEPVINSDGVNSLLAFY